MTALTQYQRLECLGLWRDRPDGRRRDVVVSLGDASLVISDTRSDTALTHWSLPAVERLNPGQLPALYTPGREGIETLELEDGTMIGALDKVHGVIESQKQRPGRLRQALLATGLALILGLGVFWLPGALVRHTAALVPVSKRAEIGRLVLARMVPVTGPPCAQSEGLAALGTLRDRVLGMGKGELVVLPKGIDATARLPGQVVLIAESLIEDHDNPDIVAGFVLAEALRADLADPMVALLKAAGLRATVALLTTGDLPATALAAYADAVLAEGRRAVADAALLQRFTASGIAATPYALTVDPSGTTTAALRAGDPFATAPAPVPVMDDSAWVTLQGICAQ